MQTRVHASRTPTILYVDYLHKDGINRRRLDGLRRYAATHKWRVATLKHGVCSPSALREAFARLRPIGCAVECWSPETTLPPFLFGRVPAVYFSRQEGRGWQGACSVEVDDAAVARKAFAELSLSNPCAYAIVTTNSIRKRWTRERIDNFRECCRKAGFDCPVSHFPGETEKQRDARPALMKAWAAALPRRCAALFGGHRRDGTRAMPSPAAGPVRRLAQFGTERRPRPCPRQTPRARRSISALPSFPLHSRGLETPRHTIRCILCIFSFALSRGILQGFVFPS